MAAEKSLEKNFELIKLWGGAAKDICLAKFIRGIASRLKSKKDPHGAERSFKRMEIWGLIRRLQCNVFKDPPYDQKVADQIRSWLKNDLHSKGFDLIVDFERLLFTAQYEAEAIKKYVAKIKEAQAEEERKKKEEWDMIEKEEAVEEWDMIEKEEAVEE